MFNLIRFIKHQAHVDVIGTDAGASLSYQSSIPVKAVEEASISDPGILEAAVESVHVDQKLPMERLDMHVPQVQDPRAHGLLLQQAIVKDLAKLEVSMFL
jgi:hypothetical protein